MPENEELLREDRPNSTTQSIYHIRRHGPQWLFDTNWKFGTIFIRPVLSVDAEGTTASSPSERASGGLLAISSLATEGARVTASLPGCGRKLHPGAFKSLRLIQFNVVQSETRLQIWLLHFIRPVSAIPSHWLLFLLEKLDILHFLCFFLTVTLMLVSDVKWYGFPSP